MWQSRDTIMMHEVAARARLTSSLPFRHLFEWVVQLHIGFPCQCYMRLSIHGNGFDPDYPIHVKVIPCVFRIFSCRLNITSSWTPRSTSSHISVNLYPPSSDNHWSILACLHITPEITLQIAILSIIGDHLPQSKEVPIVDS